MSNKIIFGLMMVITLVTVRPADAKEAIVFSRQTDGYWQIWTMDPDGSHQRVVTSSKIDKRDPVWIQSGKGIAFRTNNGELFTVGLNGDKEKEILTNFKSINNPHYCETTGEVVFVRFDPRTQDASNIWKTDLDGKKAVVLTRDSMLKYQPAFSVDGAKVAFVRADPKTLAHHIWLIDADGSHPRQLTHKTGFSTLPSFSPDGKRVTFTSNYQDGNYEIYILNVENLQITRVTHYPGLDTHSRFSRDGQKLVFVSDRGGNQQVWVMDIDGKNAKQLTSGTEESINPSWGEIRE